MAQLTSAEFLTFMRYARPSTLSRSLARSTQRPFLAQSSIRGYAGASSSGAAKNETHATDKGGLDVQSDTANAGQEAAKSSDDTSMATQGRDTTNANKRAVEENPEAPGKTVIGMNDERGGKGH